MEYTGDKSVISNGTVVLDFYATWCGPCKKLKPQIVALAEEMPQITFVCVDTDVWTALSEHYIISSLPTLIVLFNGKAINRFEGLPRDFRGWVRDVMLPLP